MIVACQCSMQAVATHMAFVVGHGTLEMGTNQCRSESRNSGQLGACCGGVKKCCRQKGTCVYATGDKGQTCFLVSIKVDWHWSQSCHVGIGIGCNPAMFGMARLQCPPPQNQERELQWSLFAIPNPPPLHIKGPQFNR
jgi:hypothetical protein